jgi:site-specific DNA-methyltransferase (adenine-specific)
MELCHYVEWCKTWMEECLRILKSTGTGYIYGFSEILAYLFPEIKSNKRWLVWYYTNKNVAKNPFWQRSHESIICFWKSTDERIFNLDEVREPYTETFIKNAAGKVRAATKGRFSKTSKETIYKAHEKGALPRDVIKIPALAGGAGRRERFFYCKDCNDLFLGSLQKLHEGHNIVVHPTQKPFDLNMKLIKAAKPLEQGRLVVPFAGTGSEMFAARQLNVDTIGFDINEDYVTMANLLIKKGYPIKC